MIRVLHLRATDRICGPGKTILESCERIDKNNFSLSIGLLSNLPPAENAFWQAATERGFPIRVVTGRSRFGFEQVDAIVRLVRDNDIDIIHSHEYKTDLLGLLASRKTGTKIVTTAHGWISNTWRSKLYLWAGKRILRWFDYVIAVSPLIEQEIRARGVRSDRVGLIHNAIVMENYVPADVQPGFLRKRFSIPAGTRIVGNIGRISPEKGQGDFVKAALRILGSRNDMCFVLVGDGPDMQSLQQQVSERELDDKIFFTGHVTDVRPVLRDLDIMALTSYTEGFPNVVLESICMGVPVLATDVGGVAEIVTDGETGILVSPGDVEGIATGLLSLADDPHAGEEMVVNGRRRIVDDFSFSQRIAKVEDVYRRVLSAT